MLIAILVLLASGPPRHEYKVPEWTKPANRQKVCVGHGCDCAYHRWLKRGSRVVPADPDLPVIIPAGD